MVFFFVCRHVGPLGDCHPLALGLGSFLVLCRQADAGSCDRRVSGGLSVAKLSHMNGGEPILGVRKEKPSLSRVHKQ